MKMKRELYDYDIFPKVFLTGRPARLTVKPLGIHASFAPGAELTLRLCESSVAEPRRFPGSAGVREYRAAPTADGNIELDTKFMNIVKPAGRGDVPAAVLPRRRVEALP